MPHDDLPQRLAQVKSVSVFYDFAHEIAEWDRSDAFESLFAIAIESRRYPVPTCVVAADLLLKVEPPCPMPCREAILRVAQAHWDLSLRQIPFYLVTQFGKRQVADMAAALASEAGLSSEARQAVETVQYWTRYPSTDLVSHYFCRWEPKGESNVA